jgi:C1A family cysteine protease
LSAYGVLGPDPKKHFFAAYSPKVTHGQLPLNVSYEYLFPPVFDQGQVGTCVAQSTSALMAAIIYKRVLNRIDISRRAIYSLTKQHFETEFRDQEGLYVVDALRVLESIGYVLETDFPEGTPTAESILQPVPLGVIKGDHLLKDFYRVGGGESVHAELVDNMKLALFEKGPIAIGIQFHKDWEQCEAPGFLNASPSPDIAGGHEMVVVGYSEKKAAFRIRNSWGTTWGDGGYCWLPFTSTVLPDDAYTITL